MIHLGTWSLKNCVPNKKILAKVLVFMGDFGAWAQVLSKGSCRVLVRNGLTDDNANFEFDNAKIMELEF